jgi:hypothetical protein
MRLIIYAGLVFFIGCASRLSPNGSPHQACQNGDMEACNQSIPEDLNYFKKGCRAGDQDKCREYQDYNADYKASRSPQVLDKEMFDRISQ